MSEVDERDLELLRLAAKAANLEIESCTCRDPKWPFRLKGQSGVRAHWNPLINDGDALKLAVELRLDIEINAGGVNVYSGDLDDGLYEPVNGDLGDCTRRAIVRVAAQVGELP
ncbi:hypothetical protein ACK1VC_07220 [Pseudomonas sp. XP2]|uniref:hypothetical protein n=1 Tax=Pseudomonas monteilii TaxID=76759 RepID=UPI0018A4AB52|nr:hypothetical protein [Pseudomonas monteilii]BBV96412.1 hypothetical protein STW0522PSE72_17630 [Pseudomonas monteilii]